MYRSYCWGPGEAAIDKGPDIHQIRCDILARAFPEGRFVLIFRDPVANVEGLRRKWKLFGAEPLKETIRFYAAIHETLLDEISPHKDRLTVVEYERFTRTPEAVLERLGDRLGLRPAERRRRLPKAPNVEGQGIRNVRGGLIDMVKDSSARARARLAAEDIDQVEQTLTPLVVRLRELAALTT